MAEGPAGVVVFIGTMAEQKHYMQNAGQKHFPKKILNAHKVLQDHGFYGYAGSIEVVLCSSGGLTTTDYWDLMHEIEHHQAIYGKATK